jgi:hypothetical protein
VGLELGIAADQLDWLLEQDQVLPDLRFAIRLKGMGIALEARNPDARIAREPEGDASRHIAKDSLHGSLRYGVPIERRHTWSTTAAR